MAVVGSLIIIDVNISGKKIMKKMNSETEKDSL